MADASGPGPGGGPGKEVLVEMVWMGNAVKVTAVDPDTRIEVSIVGAPAAGEEALKRAAVDKLAYVLRKRRGDGPS